MRVVGYACGVMVLVGVAAFTLRAQADVESGRTAEARVTSERAGERPPDAPRPDPAPGAIAAEPVAEPTAPEEMSVAALAPPSADGPPSSSSGPAAHVATATPATPARRVTRPDRSRRRSSRSRWAYRFEPLPSPAEWTPPEGPVRIALQAGHWRAAEAPPELSGLKDNGTRGGGLYEWEANLAIARAAADQLRDMGYEVDVLPAVVPPGYRAHVFIAIHADGSNDSAARGYRVAAPRTDPTGRAGDLVRLLEERYGDVTGLRRLPTVTRRMQNYYAFNYGRYEHALDPNTISVIIETGFLTSPRDREVIVATPERAARGIVEAVMAFPETPPPPRVATSDGTTGSR